MCSLRLATRHTRGTCPGKRFAARRECKRNDCSLESAAMIDEEPHDDVLDVLYIFDQLGA